MLNNYAIIVGFVEKEPTLEEDMVTHDKVCTFNIVTKDLRSIKSVTCLATGRLCDQLMIHALRGTFWCVGGVIFNHKTEKMKKPALTLKCIEIELLHTPKIPGIGVKEFVEKYSPENIIKRAKERTPK